MQPAELGMLLELSQVASAVVQLPVWTRMPSLIFGSTNNIMHNMTENAMNNMQDMKVITTKTIADYDTLYHDHIISL